MSNSNKKIFVKFIPKDTTEDELRKFFSVCGKVTSITCKESSRVYKYSFITYGTKTGAERAIKELDGRVLINNKGNSNMLSVVQHIEMTPEERRQQLKENQQEKELVTSSKEYQELWQTWKANEEKIKQIYNKKDEEKEIDKLREKLNQLQAKKSELETTNDTLIQGNNLLRLQVKIKNLEVENMKLKEGK